MTVVGKCSLDCDLMTIGPMEPKLGVWYRVIGRYNVQIMYVGYGTEICGYYYMFTSCTWAMVQKFVAIVICSHHVHSCQQKSIGLKFSKSQTGSDVQYSCHHNSSRFAFPRFAHSCRFSVLHSLQSLTPRIY